MAGQPVSETDVNTAITSVLLLSSDALIERYTRLERSTLRLITETCKLKEEADAWFYYARGNYRRFWGERGRVRHCIEKLHTKDEMLAGQERRLKDVELELLH